MTRLAVVAWCALLVGLFVYGGLLKRYRDESGELAREVIATEKVEVAPDSFIWGCDGYRGDFDAETVDGAPASDFVDQLLGIGFYEVNVNSDLTFPDNPRQRTFLRDRADSFEYDAVELTEGQSSIEIRITLWRTDVIACVPEWFAAELVDETG